MAEALSSGSATKLDFTFVVMAASSRNSPVLSRLDVIAQPTSMSTAMMPTAHPFHTFHCRIDAYSSSPHHGLSSCAALQPGALYSDTYRKPPPRQCTPP